MAVRTGRGCPPGRTGSSLGPGHGAAGGRWQVGQGPHVNIYIIYIVREKRGKL